MIISFHTATKSPVDIYTNLAFPQKGESVRINFHHSGLQY